MTLAAGTRVGHFEVLAPLGAGGMGEVYRARDTRLGRDVALKALPEALARNAERRSRLEREARLLATLSHSGIASIYGLEDDAGFLYLVMELIEGESLDRRLERGRLTVWQALEVGRQIAEALESAHAKGIIHRDLKPSNVKLTQEDHVKLLDFGLAKALASAQEKGTSERTTDLTATDAVVGTAPYMSPEQVRGESLDRRTDIWSFGCVLYELLAGVRAFPGHGSEVIASILEREPEWRALPTDTPIRVQHLLKRCLNKDRARRLRDIADARIEIEEALAERSTGAIKAIRRRRIGIVALLLALLAGTHAGLFHLGRQTGKAPIPSFTRLTFRLGTMDAARFTPDGQTVVYSARWDGKPSEVFSQRLGSVDARPFDLEGARIAAIAGAEMAVVLGDGTLARVPLEGGAPREVLENVSAADLTIDGTRFAVVRNIGERQRLECPIGKVLYETTGFERMSDPRLSPAGDYVSFIKWSSGLLDDTSGDIVIVDLSGRKRLLSSGWESIDGLAWSANGREIYFTAARVGMIRALHAVTLSGSERLVARVMGNLTVQDVAQDGRILLSHVQRRTVMRGRMAGDASERDLSWLDGTFTPNISPDGTRIVFDECGEGGGVWCTTYMRSSDGLPPMRLGDGGPFDVSPDWKWALVLNGHRASGELRLVPLGPGESKTLPRGSIHSYAWVFWHPDGKRIIIRGNEANRPPRLFIQRIPDGLPRPLSPEGVIVMRRVSPDGLFVVARLSGRRGRWMLYPIKGGDPHPIAGLDVGYWPLGWSEDGHALFALTNRRRFPTQVVRFDLHTRSAQPWLELAPPDRSGVSNVYHIAITPDGQYYVYSFRRTLSDLYLVQALR